MSESIGWVKERLVTCDRDLINLLATTYFLWGFVVFCILVLGITAPYGRYARSGWGLYVNGKLAWFVQELPSFLVPVILIFYTESPRLALLPNKILVGLFLIHYFQRALVFPFLIKGGKPTPMVPFLLALVFCLINGYVQVGSLLYHVNFSNYWYRHPSFILGVSLFIFGFCVNIHSDHILRNLRKPGETGYKIPKGGMFEYVSGANFFGEMTEWLGFAIACWSLPGMAFAFFTFANIGPRAYQHHKWYLEKFEDYPKERKAVIPFIL